LSAHFFHLLFVVSLCDLSMLRHSPISSQRSEAKQGLSTTTSPPRSHIPKTRWGERCWYCI